MDARDGGREEEEEHTMGEQGRVGERRDESGIDESE
jgi:hypothetical protein